MSCRVLKRTLEAFVLNYLVDKLKQKNISVLFGEYLETPKNIIVSNLYTDMGFSSTEEKHKYKLDINGYKTLNNKIISK